MKTQTHSVEYVDTASATNERMEVLHILATFFYGRPLKIKQFFQKGGCLHVAMHKQLTKQERQAIERAWQSIDGSSCEFSFEKF